MWDTPSSSQPFNESNAVLPWEVLSYGEDFTAVGALGIFSWPTWIRLPSRR
jgi:hypothetical protein